MPSSTSSGRGWRARQRLAKFLAHLATYDVPAGTLVAAFEASREADVGPQLGINIFADGLAEDILDVWEDD